MNSTGFSLVLLYPVSSPSSGSGTSLSLIMAHSFNLPILPVRLLSLQSRLRVFADDSFFMVASN
jgi:hypothetical protein